MVKRLNTAFFSKIRQCNPNQIPSSLFDVVQGKGGEGKGVGQPWKKNKAREFSDQLKDQILKLKERKTMLTFRKC